MIFIFTHKPTPYVLPDNSIYKPLQVGAALHPELDLCEFKDNQGVNISEWNQVYAELTGQYEIAYNLLEKCSDKYVGQCQYRRWLFFRENTDFDAIFTDWKAITCRSCNCITSVANHFAQMHSAYYLRLCVEIITKLYPDYAESIKKYWFGDSRLFYSNSFILPKEDYLRYSDFLFSILEAFREHEGLQTVAQTESYVANNIKCGVQKAHAGYRPGRNYDLQIFGFLGERLWDLWVRHNYEGYIFQIPFTLKENTGI